MSHEYSMESLMLNYLVIVIRYANINDYIYIHEKMFLIYIYHCIIYRRVVEHNVDRHNVEQTKYRQTVC